jgi:tRNA-specific 2-thiouridylase
MKNVLLGMSGGIDSSISAVRLQNMGFNVSGIYLKLHQASKQYHDDNINNIDNVCKKLNISYTVLDLQKEFEESIKKYFVDSYKNGLTPNPCVVCNKNIKFGLLFDYMEKLNYDYLATGHYANIEDNFITEALDKTKDQSYFLSKIDRNVLQKVIFPLGNTIKDKLKDSAKEQSLFKKIAKQKESSGICFVQNSYIEVLDEYFDTNKKGVIRNSSGEIIGTHNGYAQYTIGKRKGLDIKSALEPHYVLSISAKNNEVIVGKQNELKQNIIYLKEAINYYDSDNLCCEIKLRYGQLKQKCTIKFSGHCATVHLNEPAFGIAPGQVGVFYDNNKVIGSGIIDGSSYES